MKKNLIKDGFGVSEKIGQLKLKSQDGKYRMTDVCDIEGMFRIIESIPSKNAEPIVVTKTNKLNYEYIEDKKVKKISDKTVKHY